MAATDPDSMKLKLGPDGSLQMDSSSRLPGERSGGQPAWDDFKDGFAEVITLMTRLGFSDLATTDRRDWLNFVDRDTGLSANYKLAASRLFIQQFCGQPLWSPCINSNPTIWIRSHAGTLPSFSRNGGDEGDSNQRSQQNAQQNNRQNNRRNNQRSNQNANRNNQNAQRSNQNNRNNNQGNNQRQIVVRKRSRSRSPSPRRRAPPRRSRSPASRSPPGRGPRGGGNNAGSNSRPNHAPNRSSTVCDSRTHNNRNCGAERDGRTCPFSHVCQNGCPDSHPLSRCPKA